MKHPSVWVFLFLFFVGCAAGPEIRTVEDVFVHTQIFANPEKNTTWIATPFFSAYQESGYYRAFLRARVQGREIQYYQLYVSDIRRDWRFYDRAYDSDGRPLAFAGVDHEAVTKARSREDFVIFYGRQHLNRLSSTGITVKAVGHGGARVFALPAYYVQGFLSRVDRYLSE